MRLFPPPLRLLSMVQPFSLQLRPKPLVRGLLCAHGAASRPKAAAVGSRPSIAGEGRGECR